MYDIKSLSRLSAFSIFSKSEKGYLYSTSIINIAQIIFGVFINFYLWEKTNDFSLVVYYNLGYFLSVPLISLLVGFMSEKLNIGLVYKIGLILFIIFGIIIIFVKSINPINAFIIGAIFGGFGAFRFIPSNILFFAIVRKEVANSFSALSSQIWNVINIIFPFLISLIIGFSNDYRIVFVIAIFVIIYAIYSVNQISVKTVSDGEYQLKKVLRIDKNKDKWLLFLAKIFEGGWSAINTVLISILSLVILGKIEWWGLMQIVLSVVTIIGLSYFSKNVDYYKSKYVILPIAVVYLCISVVFALNLNVLWYMVFSIAHTTLMTMFWCVLRSLNGSILNADNYISKLRVEYNVINEIPLAIGRVIPLLIMIVFSINFEAEMLYAVIFFVILMGSMPYFEALVYTKTKLLSEKL